MEIEVGYPILMKATFGDYHVYPLTGRDSLGDFECNRRFSNFVDFHQSLTFRYPGLYIPPIPEKTQDKKN